MTENAAGGAPAEPANYALFKMACGYWISQSLYVVTKLGVPDLLVAGPKTAEELAAATGTDGPSLYRILRALATQGVFAEDDSRRFRQTPISDCLVDRPASQRAMIIMMGEEHYRAYGDLMYSVRTGKPCFDHVYGMPIFEYLSKHPDAAATFDAAMTGIHGRETAAMIDAYDFSQFRTVLDIGGGNGTVLRTVLEKYPAMQGMLYDLPHVIERAKPAFAASAAGPRAKLVGGSFFESVPEGADAYMMRHIIHDWNDEQCRTILGHCRRVMKPEAKLLVIDAVIKAGNEPQFSKFLDITMLALPGGKERTEAEFRTLFRSAGFELTRIVPTTSEVSIIEGRPA